MAYSIQELVSHFSSVISINENPKKPLNLFKKTRFQFLRNLCQLCLLTCSANILKHNIYNFMDAFFLVSHVLTSSLVSNKIFLTLMSFFGQSGPYIEPNKAPPTMVSVLRFLCKTFSKYLCLYYETLLFVNNF